MKSRRDAILQGARAAAKIHREFDLRRQVEAQASNVDVFGTIVKEKIPLMFRPLEGLLGAFLPGPVPGIIVTTQRPLSVQRFTGAHELGHAAMGHEASLDDESMLTRSESPVGTTIRLRLLRMPSRPVSCSRNGFSFHKLPATTGPVAT